MRALLVVIGCLLSTRALSAAQPETVIAKVGAQPITLRMVDRELVRARGQVPDDAADRKERRTVALEACIRRTLALQELATQKKNASDTDVDQAVARLKKQLTERATKWEKYVEKAGLSEAELREEIRWGLTWDAYLKEQLADPNLQRYFDRHKREFDGTQMRVAHLLLKLPEDAKQEAKAELVTRAEQIRADIASGKLTFADAAKKHSAAPTAANGGDIGWIERRQPMPEPFSKAAFELEVGKVSAPVTSTLGVHLIQCLEVKPGKLTWRDSRDELRAAVTRYLFDWLADRGAKAAKIERVDSSW